MDAGDPGECHTWRAWGSHIRKKQTDQIIGPRDLQSTTRHVNRTKTRTWDPVPVVVKIDGKELRVKKGKKGKKSSEIQFSKQRLTDRSFKN